MRIIVDAMGGDNAPLAIVKGAVQGQKRWGVDITLTGDESAIRNALSQCGISELPQGMDIVPTTEEVTWRTIPPRCSAGRRQLHGRGPDAAA